MSSIADTRRVAPSLGTFERYLTLWVALCIVAGIVLRPVDTGTVPDARPYDRSRGQHSGRSSDLADDRADAAQVGLWCAEPRHRPVARDRRDGRVHLAGQAVQLGT